MRYGSPKGRSRSERRFQDRPPRVRSPVNYTPPTQPILDPAIREGRKSQEDPNDAMPVEFKGPEKYMPEDWSWEEEMIFKELPVKVTKDLIREPLPSEWTDEPLMPPKYDKETVTSRYITPTNVDDFALSVRETKAWQVLQHHPAFLPLTDIRVEKLRDYESALNQGTESNKQDRPNNYNNNNRSSSSSNSRSSSGQRGNNWISRGRSGRQNQHSYLSSESLLNHIRPGPTKRSWDQADHRGAEMPEEESELSGKKPKISSPEPGEVCETDDQEPTSATKSSSPSWEEDKSQARQSDGDRITNMVHNSQVALTDVRPERDDHRSSPPAPLSPLPLSNRPSGSGSHLSSRRDSLDRPSRPSSRCSSTASPLTPNERELLGIVSDSDSDGDSPLPPPNDASARSRQRPAKLHAAYS
jgi:hypothetical protein